MIRTRLWPEGKAEGTRSPEALASDHEVSHNLHRSVGLGVMMHPHSCASTLRHHAAVRVLVLEALPTLQAAVLGGQREAMHY